MLEQGLFLTKFYNYLRFKFQKKKKKITYELHVLVASRCNFVRNFAHSSASDPYSYKLVARSHNHYPYARRIARSQNAFQGFQVLMAFDYHFACFVDYNDDAMMEGSKIRLENEEK